MYVCVGGVVCCRSSRMVVGPSYLTYKSRFYVMSSNESHHRILTGACEGVCACSTCHVILEEEVYDSLDEPSEEEEDMLDQAFGLTTTSRLGCQIELREDMDGIKVRVCVSFARGFGEMGIR